MTKIIQLSKGYEAIVDDEDFKLVNIFKWRAEVKSNTVYAVRMNANRTNMYMHRYILETKEKKNIDHLDGNGLNNTRDNIRILSQSANNAKRKSKGVFTGVTRMASGNYRVVIRRNGEARCLGTYNTAEKAIEIRKKAEIKWYGVELRGET